MLRISENGVHFLNFYIMWASSFWFVSLFGCPQTLTLSNFETILDTFLYNVDTVVHSPWV